MRVTMIGGPKDGRSYNYTHPLPDVLSFQRFGANFQAHSDDYRRRPYTRQYVYVQPTVGYPKPVQL